MREPFSGKRGKVKMSEKVRIQEVFAHVHTHQRIAELIQRFSSNTQGVHQTALEGLDLKQSRDILDLGCAFGSFTGKLKGRVDAQAVVTGVDTVAAYESPFLTACRQAGVGGRFISTGASVLNGFADRSFDLILCSYALYFFPEAVPEIARLLRRNGVFVTITHHRRNSGELIRLTKKILDTLGLYREKHLPMEIIAGRFSSENGRALLTPWFGNIRTIDFPNSLVFTQEDIVHLKDYFRFKSPLYLADTSLDPEVVMPMVLDRLARAASEQKGMKISKDDSIFICTSPRHREDRA
jgi:ubiquinone/menaquinone biosynthesis C-methylase UbiE